MTQNVPRGTMTIGNALRTALGIFSGKMIFICETGRFADLPVSLFSRKGRKGEQVVFSFTSSPSQSPSVTALPKGEPLAVHIDFIFLPMSLPLTDFPRPGRVCQRGRLLAMPESCPPRERRPLGGAAERSEAEGVYCKAKARSVRRRSGLFIFRTPR